MKVLQVNKVFSGSNKIANQEKQLNFKGLWGDTEYDSYSSRECEDSYTMHHYYPFKNESKKEIDAIVERHSFYETYAANVYDAVTQTTSVSVIVHEALPFTAKDFTDYLNNCVSNLKRIVIEKHIIEKNLRKTL